MSKEDAKLYNAYWDNVAATKGNINGYNKAIKKSDELGDYHEVKLKYEKGVK
ncbi:hypothetical protein [Clostridium estertheticum]|nr:hypothetical protein [Clostridium estertheticum]MBZ9617856.1 hypothetical protein [Clostridium estertheticum subsp. laramiense]WAG73520.1 hypothetical protein LL032_20725 [Clostridium estertheticum]